MESFNENPVVHRRARTKHPCFFASYSRGEHGKEHFVLFDEEADSVYDSQHALVLGRMAFKRLAIPKAEIERIIPTTRPITIEEKQEEEKVDDDDDADHELGRLWEYEPPEEEIVFGLGDEEEVLDTGEKRKHHGSETKRSESTLGNSSSKIKGWVMKSDKKGTYLRKGNSELFFDVPVRVDRKKLNGDDENPNANEFHLTTQCSHDMVFLYHILTNAGLSVGFPFKNEHTCKETFETKTSWSMKGRTKNMNVNENLFRKLKGNGFSGVECDIKPKTPKKPSVRVSKTSRRSSFLDGLFDALYEVQGMTR